MDPTDLAVALDRELARFRDGLARAAAAPGGLDLPVAACPGWTVRDLAHHVGQVERWVCHAVDHGNPEAPAPEWPADDDLGAWFAAGAADLVAHLDVDPSTPAWSFGHDKNVAFWQRRQAHEHAVHAWDLLSALGTPAEPDIETRLADDGIDEVVGMFLPRQIRLGRLTEPADALAVVSTDTGRRWTLGSGPVAATLTGPASDVLLALWHRRSASHPTLSWDGHPARGHELLTLPWAP
ncbi:MAG: maleylpyruvate isomerase family mycothiol-dependent enzyme [Nocardioidaceae bacterium]